MQTDNTFSAGDNCHLVHWGYYVFAENDPHLKRKSHLPPDIYEQM